AHGDQARRHRARVGALAALSGTRAADALDRATHVRQQGLGGPMVLLGAAGSWPMTNLAPRVLRGDFAPGFYAKHRVKDLGLALETAREAGVELPGLELAARLYDRVVSAGDGDLGTQALARRYFALA
ncbi:MAG: NAD-binding protein, partial [Verrucomicrobiota bacterium]